MKKPIILLGLFLLTTLCFPITIIGNYIGPGGQLPFGEATGSAPASLVGTDLTTIFNAAAGLWSGLIADTHTITINYGWTNYNGQLLGQYSSVSTNAENRDTIAQIGIDNSNNLAFWADPTPLDNSEFTTFNSFTQNFGGGLMNTGKHYTGATGNASGRFDLMTTFTHEMGHMFFRSDFIFNFFESADGDIDVTAPRRFAGSQIPVSNGPHLNLPHTLMYWSGGPGERKLISDADLEANMQLGNFNSYGPVAEPVSLIILGFGISCLLINRKK